MFVDLLFVLVVAMLLTFLFSAAFSWTGPWPGFAWFFVLILLTSWAAGLWVRPFGPPLFGVFWMPYLVFGLIAALLVAAASPPEGARRRPGSAPRPPSERDEDVAAEGAAVAVGLFFWLLVLVLVTAVVIGYL